MWPLFQRFEGSPRPPSRLLRCPVARLPCPVPGFPSTSPRCARSPARVSRRRTSTTRMVEFQQLVLPPSMYPAGSRGRHLAVGLPGRRQAGVLARCHRGGDARHAPPPSPTSTPAASAATSRLEPLLTIDQTIHWAAPLSAGNSATSPTRARCPRVAHLHGAEVPSAFDGAPEAWFTPDGRHGSGVRHLRPHAPNSVVYQLPEHPAVDHAVVPRPRAGHHPDQRVRRPGRLLPGPRRVRHRRRRPTRCGCPQAPSRSS